MKETTKEQKALKIIKEKEVDAKLFFLCITTPIVDVKTMEISSKLQLEMYNDGVINNSVFVADYRRCLTQEEFDLLKEVLE